MGKQEKFENKEVKKLHDVGTRFIQETWLSLHENVVEFQEDGAWLLALCWSQVSSIIDNWHQREYLPPPLHIECTMPAGSLFRIWDRLPDWNGHVPRLETLRCLYLIAFLWLSWAIIGNWICGLALHCSEALPTEIWRTKFSWQILANHDQHQEGCLGVPGHFWWTSEPPAAATWCSTALDSSGLHSWQRSCPGSSGFWFVSFSAETSSTISGDCARQTLLWFGFESWAPSQNWNSRWGINDFDDQQHYLEPCLTFQWLFPAIFHCMRFISHWQVLNIT